jgi:hypothetical protein
MLLSPRLHARKGVSGKNKINFEFLCGLCDSAREKTTKLSLRRKARKVVWGKNKFNIEVFCGLCVTARENKYNLAEAQST